MIGRRAGESESDPGQALEILKLHIMYSDWAALQLRMQIPGPVRRGKCGNRSPDR